MVRLLGRLVGLWALRVAWQHRHDPPRPGVRLVLTLNPGWRLYSGSQHRRYGMSMNEARRQMQLAALASAHMRSAILPVGGHRVEPHF